MTKKYVTIEKDRWTDTGYTVLTSSNGYQWHNAFTGSMRECRIILSTFKRIGFEHLLFHKRFQNTP